MRDSTNVFCRHVFFSKLTAYLQAATVLKNFKNQQLRLKNVCVSSNYNVTDIIVWSVCIMGRLLFRLI